MAPYTCSHTSGCAFPARVWAFCSEFQKIYFLSSARLPCWWDLRILEISHPLFYNFIQPSKAVKCANSPCGWSSQPLVSDVTQSRVDSPLNLTPGEPVRALLSSPVPGAQRWKPAALPAPELCRWCVALPEPEELCLLYCILSVEILVAYICLYHGVCFWGALGLFPDQFRSILYILQGAVVQGHWRGSISIGVQFYTQV